MPVGSLVGALNDLACGAFLLTAFALVVVRQVQECLWVFVLQSFLLASSGFLLAVRLRVPDLVAVGALTLAVKTVLIPWLLRRTVQEEIYARRELAQLVTVPASLLVSLALAVGAYLLTTPLGTATVGAGRANLPIGTAGLLVGAYTIAVRREAVPQVIAILAMENGAFLAGVAVAPDLPLIAELAASFDVLVIALVMGLLTRALHEHVGTTDVATLRTLREEPAPWSPS